MTALLAVPLRWLGGEARLPARLLGDRAYASQRHQAILRWLGTEAVFAQRGRERYVVEQPIAALHQDRRLKVGYGKRSDMRRAFLTLACIKVCFDRLSKK